MTSILPLEILETAPRIWVGPQGWKVRVRDPKWQAEQEAMFLLRSEAERKAVLAQERRRRLSKTSGGITRMLIEDIAKAHGVELSAITGTRGIKAVILARHHVAYELRRQRHLSYPQIGRLLGGRDHTTIITAVRRWPEKAAALGIPCLPIETRVEGLHAGSTGMTRSALSQHEPLIFGGQDNG